MGRSGREAVIDFLDKHRSEYDFIIANGENATHSHGLSMPVYRELSKHGIDGFTMGNHTWGCPDIVNIMRYNDNVIRPANYDKSCPGKGSMILTKGDKKIGVINLIGRVNMPLPFDSPFMAADREIEYLKSKADIILVDFHAETTSEKKSLGYYLDGRVSAVFGTHTHVQTADEEILFGGTGYITDLGMTGPVHSVIGMEKQIIINRFINGMNAKFAIATGEGQLCACEFEVDEETAKCTAIKRLFIKGGRE